MALRLNVCCLAVVKAPHHHGMGKDVDRVSIAIDCVSLYIASIVHHAETVRVLALTWYWITSLVYDGPD